VSKGQEVSMWAGVAAFFGSLLAIGIFDVFEPDQWVEYIGALIVGFITAGAIYAQQRLAFAKERVNGNGHPPDEPPEPTQLPA